MFPSWRLAGGELLGRLCLREFYKKFLRSIFVLEKILEMDIFAIFAA